MHPYKTEMVPTCNPIVSVSRYGTAFRSAVRLLFTLALLLSGAAFTQSFDVVVLGSEPEAIAAAVAASQEGASVLLATHDERLGGLLITGEMNSLDVRTSPVNFQRGVFLDWWERVGLAHSYDVLRGEAAFEAMLAEAGVRVLRGVDEMTPLFALLPDSNDVDLSGPVGVQLDGRNVRAKQLIDGTADADFAAAAGARFTFGFESIGLDERMADTLVFRIAGVDWQALTSGIRARGGNYASVGRNVAWGHFGGYPAAYEALEPGIRLRGLNMGRQDDGSLLVNALLIHGIDPFDPESVREGRARAEREAPRIVEYLRQELPGFAQARYAGAADTLYVRETRHLLARCILSVDDVMDNRVTEQAIAAGGYPLDVQVLTPHDNGYVFGSPDIYGVELCVSVPDNVANLWVVGKAAGYDPIAHSSARVVPFGMVVAEAVGLAAARSARDGLQPVEFASDVERIAWLRSRLTERGAYLPPVQPRNPVGPWQHPHYEAYRLLLSRGLALGGYENDPRLDDEVSALSYVYMLSNVAQRFLDDHSIGPRVLANFQYDREPLTPERGALITSFALCRLELCTSADWTGLQQAGVIAADFNPGSVLTRGEMHELAVGFLRFVQASYH